MKHRFWLFKRRGVFYVEDTQTGEQKSLGTQDRKEAERLRATKHDSKSRRKAPKLGEHPAMKELFRMVEAAEINQYARLSHEQAEVAVQRPRASETSSASFHRLYRKSAGRGSRF
jgi:FtsZ-interacting cell division protein YlmF